MSGDVEKAINNFYVELDKMLALATEQLLHRYNLLKKLKVRDIPFNFSGIYMGSEKLGMDDTIEEALKNGTLAYGFIGLAQALVALVGVHHGESEGAQKLGLDIVRHIREYADKVSDEYDLNFGLIATPKQHWALVG